MEKRQIGVITLVCVLGCCLLISATAFGQCNTSLCLEIEILPNGTYNPQDICESRPLNLKFKYRQSDPTQNRTYSLHSLEYSVFNESEDLPFFKDTLNLTDNTLPYEINESPGIYTPPDSTKIRVEAKLVYTSDKDEIAEAQPVEANLTAPMIADYIIERTYDRMRDGYIRRHILDAGRGLSWLWLKEYEPCLDSKELLRHSRTFKADGQGQTRVYVPWTRKCIIEGSDDQCGASVVENSDVIYGGDENPLLRGGLAMATFALEYLAYGRPDSLNHAMKLFEYVEKSEWRNPATDELTGFFLRSRWPGNTDSRTQRPYFYASADELSGMSLGLLYLNEALWRALAYENPDVNYPKVW
ncbi:MAG: hypothetical protein LUO89_08235, partial [Methanothrix sp.]|nr:hypothetical protein [Methanothrix sp.]